MNTRMSSLSRHEGVTLVELLVVIAIIGMLMGLLLPAVQQAREAARSTQCSNNLKQLVTGAMNHVSIVESYPTGGWHYYMVGDADRGFGESQPGSWYFCILPYIEQSALYQLSALGENPNSAPSGTKKANGLTLITTPIPMFHCPSRRKAKLYTYGSGNTGTAGKIYNANSSSSVARGDYAASFGDNSGSSETNSLTPASYPEAVNFNLTPPASTGVVFRFSAVKDSDITDGQTNTIFCGEKYLMPGHYESGACTADNEGVFFGCDNDNQRSSHDQPTQDRIGFNSLTMWGSAHSGTVGMAMCDGSVRRISYSTNLSVWHNLGNREDGNVTSALP